MLSVGQLNEGVVLDHIPAGKAMDIYRKLKLNQMDCQVAMIMQARSSKMGLKDIIKVECPLELLNLDALGFIDHTITVNIIRDGEIVEKKKLKLPKKPARIPAASHPSSRDSTISSIWPMKRRSFTAASTVTRNIIPTARNNPDVCCCRHCGRFRIDCEKQFSTEKG